MGITVLPVHPDIDGDEPDKNLTNKPEGFKPSVRQIDLLRAWANPSVKPTITAVCQEAGISRETYYTWWENPEFVDWFNTAWEREMKTLGSYLDNIGLKKAATDFRYWEAMQMKYHNYQKKQAQELTGKNGEALFGEKEDLKSIAENLKTLIHGQSTNSTGDSEVAGKDALQE